MGAMMKIEIPGQDERKPVRWVGSSQKSIRELPKPIRKTFGYALDDAQVGAIHPSVKPLQGFGGAGVLEVVESDDGSTYRCVYTVKFAKAIYVLHVFQKKSKSGKKTPKHEIDLVKQRLKTAEQDYASRRETKDSKTDRE